HASSATPSQFDRIACSSVTATEYPFQQAGLDVMTFDVHRANGSLLPQIVMCAVKVFAALHAVPLIRGVCFGNKVRHAGGDFRKAAFDLFADTGDRLSHFNDAIQINISFARQATHKIKLHRFVVVFEGGTTALV